jgi:putative ABC transport system permease protein
MFFFSGIMMVLGAIWVVTYNLSPLLRGLTVLLGRLRRIAPAVKTAVAHVSSSRLRTGLIIGMFSLVVFTLTFMSVAIGASAPQYDDPLTAAGGYDILGTVSSQNPLDDINGLIEEAQSLDPSDFLFIGGYSTGAYTTLSEINRTVGMRQADVARKEWHDYPVRGADEQFLDTNNFEFMIMATEYGSSREVWQAVKENQGYAVIAADAVPTRSEEASGLSAQGFNLEGLHRDADSMPDVKVELKETDRPLTLIGVLKPSELSHGVYTSRATLEDHLGLTTRPTTYLFKLADGVDPEATAAAMESEFFTYGMEADSIASLLEKRSAIYFSVLSLLQAFVALGLVVGIAAIGVISIRAVIERRHEIGVLRAIGYRRGTVQLSFIIESSIIAVLGILIGTTLALLLSYYIVSYMQGQGETGTFEIPWFRTLAISAGIWAGSVLMTALPSRQASKVYPAEALRYE